MAWTTPKDWTTGELVTAGLLDVHLKNNLNWLKNPPKVIYNNSCAYFTTSTDFVTVDNDLSLNLTTVGGDILIQVAATIYFDATYGADNVQFRLYTDNATPSITWPVGRGSWDDARVNVSFFANRIEPAGSHNFKLQWRIVGGGAVRVDMTQVAMMAREIG